MCGQPQPLRADAVGVTFQTEEVVVISGKPGSLLLEVGLPVPPPPAIPPSHPPVPMLLGTLLLSSENLFLAG